MIFRLGVEDIEPNHWVAYVFDHPGCFSSATTQEEAIAHAPARIAEYFEWLSSYDCARPARSEPITVEVTEVFHSFTSTSDPDYIVNALFEDDRRLLTREEVEEGRSILSYSRHDLSALVQQIPTAKLTQPIPGEKRESIAGILDHIAWAEWWYFERLNLAFPRNEMRGDPLTKLEKARAQTRARLSELVGNTQVVERVGEEWSARKVLRRTLWHERDHTQHIAKLIRE